MIAKVIAHGATRAEAVRRLIAALGGAVLHGPTTNRALLLQLLGHLCIVDGPDGPGIDTGWLDAQELGDGPVPDDLLVAAAALAVVKGSSGRFPIGWRNNPSRPHTQAIGDHLVDYAFDRSNRLSLLAVDGTSIELDTFTRDLLAHTATAVVGDTVYIAGGLFAFVVPPRFVSPDEAGRAGSTVAPMPGRVVALLVDIGDSVVAGQPLLVLEAMKMEHQITSPHAGTVSELFVRPGQQRPGVPDTKAQMPSQLG